MLPCLSLSCFRACSRACFLLPCFPGSSRGLIRRACGIANPFFIIYQHCKPLYYYLLVIFYYFFHLFHFYFFIFCLLFFIYFYFIDISDYLFIISLVVDLFFCRWIRFRSLTRRFFFFLLKFLREGMYIFGLYFCWIILAGFYYFFLFLFCDWMLWAERG